MRRMWAVPIGLTAGKIREYKLQEGLSLLCNVKLAAMS